MSSARERQVFGRAFRSKVQTTMSNRQATSYLQFAKTHPGTASIPAVVKAVIERSGRYPSLARGPRSERRRRPAIRVGTDRREARTGLTRSAPLRYLREIDRRTGYSSIP